MSDLIGTYKPKVPYPQALDAPFPSRKDKHREGILETFKQVNVNLPLLEEDKSPLIRNSLKTCALLKENLKMTSLKTFF